MINVTLQDYRGFADSRGGPARLDCDEARLAPSEASMTADAAACLAWLAARCSPPEQVLVWGHSMGAAVAASAAWQATAAVARLVLESPFCSLEAEIRVTRPATRLLPVGLILQKAGVEFKCQPQTSME